MNFYSINKKLKSIHNFLNMILQEWYSKNNILFRNLFIFFKSDTVKGKENGILLVQLVKDNENTIKLAAASKVLANKHNLLISLHDVNIFWSKKHEIITRILYRKNKNLYLSFGESVLFSNNKKFYNQKFIKNELYNIIKNLNNNPENLLVLNFENILVGDLIYDTYLRFYHQPTILNIDKNVIKVIEKALNLYYSFKFLITKINLKILVNTYTSYIHHGITLRTCLQKNIDVYTVDPIFQKIQINYPFHNINHTRFNSNFNLNNEQLELAKKNLESRFLGEIDTATIYMRASAYNNNFCNPNLIEQFKIRTRNVVIFMHDFYDSPHMFRSLQFPDMYQFLKQTLAALIDLKSTSIFIKLHPNAVEGSNDIAINLINSYNSPHFYILDTNISNLNIINIKPDLICTARGTIGIEMAYHGIPTVALYDNIYTNFNFVHTCYNLKDFFLILRGDLSTQIDFNKTNILSFYYQAYINEMSSDNYQLYQILSTFSYKYDVNSDNYLEKVLSLKEEIFNDKFLNYFKEKL